MSEKKTRAELEAEVERLKAALIGATGVKVETPAKVEVSPEDRINRVLGGASDPVPADYRVAVDELLNHHFGIHVKSTSDAPTFKFTILVPKQYTKEPVYDVRPKVLSYAEGLSGVRSWCELVLKNFDDQTRARIISDRTSGNVNI